MSKNLSVAGVKNVLTPYGEESYRVEAKDVSRLVRKLLKDKYPGVKFSVVTRHGTSVNVRWTDGPPAREVLEWVWTYGAKGFDGSIDLDYYKDHWLNVKTGESRLRETDGTQGSRGYAQAVKVESPGSDWVAVHYGSHYNDATRKHSADLLRKVAAKVYEEWGVAEENQPTLVEKVGWDGKPYAYFEENSHYPPNGNGRDTVKELVYQEAAKTDATEKPEKPDYSTSEKSSPNGVKPNPDLVEVVHDRNWTWVTFPEKPLDAVRTALKTAFGARWSGKRKAWYIREYVPVDQVLDTIATNS